MPHQIAKDNSEIAGHIIASAIAFAAVTLASFLSVSVWAFPGAADSKALFSVIYAAAGCKPGFHR
jgi:hypothetical protein